MRKPSVVAFLLALAGCIEEAPRQVNPYPVGMTHTSSADLPTTVEGLSPSLRIAPKIMRRCYVRFDAVDVGMRIGLDPSALDPQDQSVLAQIAKCVTEGPLAGRSVRLVDPNVESDDNKALGLRRADAAQSYLIRLGVPAAHMTRAPADATRIRDGRLEVDVDSQP